MPTIRQWLSSQFGSGSKPKKGKHSSSGKTPRPSSSGKTPRARPPPRGNDSRSTSHRSSSKAADKSPEPPMDDSSASGEMNKEMMRRNIISKVNTTKQHGSKDGSPKREPKKAIENPAKSSKRRSKASKEAGEGAPGDDETAANDNQTDDARGAAKTSPAPPAAVGAPAAAAEAEAIQVSDVSVSIEQTEDAANAANTTPTKPAELKKATTRDRSLNDPSKMSAPLNLPTAGTPVLVVQRATSVPSMKTALHKALLTRVQEEKGKRASRASDTSNDKPSSSAMGSVFAMVAKTLMSISGQKEEEVKVEQNEEGAGSGSSSYYGDESGAEAGTEPSEPSEEKEPAQRPAHEEEKEGPERKALAREGPAPKPRALPAVSGWSGASEPEKEAQAPKPRALPTAPVQSRASQPDGTPAGATSAAPSRPVGRQSSARALPFSPRNPQASPAPRGDDDSQAVQDRSRMMIPQSGSGTQRSPREGLVSAETPPGLDRQSSSSAVQGLTLVKLCELKEAGLLSEVEFVTLKAALMDEL